MKKKKIPVKTTHPQTNRHEPKVSQSDRRKFNVAVIRFRRDKCGRRDLKLTRDISAPCALKKPSIVRPLLLPTDPDACG